MKTARGTQWERITPSSTPDIFWIITDEWRYDALRCAGHSIVRTPNLDRLAECGVYFANALCQTPTCVASRASFLSGWYSHRVGNFWFDRTSPDVPYFVDHMRKQGWCTLNLGKEHHNRRPSPFEHNTRAIWQDSQGDDPDGALYDLAEDPYETNNLFHDPAYAEVRQELTERLKQWEREAAR